jgi:uroporphyrinogen III methyltransferase/synthase
MDGRYRWVVFTSTNAVRAVVGRVRRVRPGRRAFSGVKIACVGEATADGCAPSASARSWCLGEQSSLGLLDEFPEYDSIFDPVNRCCCRGPTSPPRRWPRPA